MALPSTLLCRGVPAVILVQMLKEMADRPEGDRLHFTQSQLQEAGFEQWAVPFKFSVALALYRCVCSCTDHAHTVIIRQDLHGNPASQQLTACSLSSQHAHNPCSPCLADRGCMQ